MYVDSQELFSDAQAVTTTAISQNVLDLNPNGAALANGIQDVGNGKDVYLVILTTTAATSSGSTATINFTLESSNAVGLTSSTVHFSTGVLAAAAYAAAGTVIASVALPNANYLRYLGVRYTVASGPLTAGAFTAFLTLDVQRYLNYASGFTVA